MFNNSQDIGCWASLNSFFCCCFSYLPLVKWQCFNGVCTIHSDIPPLSSPVEHRETSFQETDVHDTIRIFYSQTNHISVPVITLMRTQENIVKAYFLQQLLCPSNFLQKFPSQGTLNTSSQRVSNSSTRSVLDCLDFCNPPSSSSPASYDQ